MLDTYGRKYVSPFIKKGAGLLLSLKLTANKVTILAFIIGVSSSIFLYFDSPVLAVLVLWLSGYLDAVDGEMARRSKNTTPWGTLMDITFDRVVEMSIVICIGIKYPDSRIFLIILCASIIFSMTVFLTVGALAEKSGIKSFYYQAGLAERTEGFILFSLMILFSNKVIVLTILFSILVLVTAMQRMIEAKRIFEK